MSEAEVESNRALPAQPTTPTAHRAQEPEMPLPSPAPFTDADWLEAEEKAKLCRDYEALRASGLSLRQAAAAAGKSVSWFSGADAPYARWQRGGVAALLPDRRAMGAPAGDITAEIRSLGWFIPAARFFYLISNRTYDRGSVPEAIRRTVSLPVLPVGWQHAIMNRFLKATRCDAVPICPPSLREKILSRERAGRDLVPETVARAITQKVTPQMVELYRRPHESSLTYLSSPGSSMLIRNGAEPSWVRAGGILEPDDGSINFPVCIPWPMGGTPCADKYGVIVGRFQWLRTIDVASRFRPGWVFVARQRASYRGADVLTLLHGLTLQHGVWEEYRCERGIWKSHLVKQAIELLKARLHTVNSARGKPFVEGGFNQDWTKLSVHFPQCDLGRYRGDTEETNKLIQSCRKGAVDPRRYFPMIGSALAAFSEITAEENRTPVNSRNWGRWIPEQRWQEQTAERPLRHIEPGSEWMFSPYAITWTVRGMLVGGRVPLFEDMSVPFDFSAPWLPEYHGAKLRLHFDACAPRCIATAVLTQDHNGHRAGEILGALEQVNETASYIRLVLGWGEDPSTIGLKAKQQAAAAMRRDLRTVMPTGRAGYSKTEISDGVANHAMVERSHDSQAAESTTTAAVPGLVREAAPPADSEPLVSPEDRAARQAQLAAFDREHSTLFD